MTPELQDAIQRAKSYGNGNITANLSAIKDICSSTKRKIEISHTRTKIVDNSRYINDQGKLELPDNISKLVDNPAYLNRQRYLARLYGVDYLLLLAEIATSKAKPSHWFARATQKKQQGNPTGTLEHYDHFKENTLKMLDKIFKNRAILKMKLQRLSVKPEYYFYYFKASKLLGHLFAELLSEARDKKHPDHWLASTTKQELAKILTI